VSFTSLFISLEKISRHVPCFSIGITSHFSSSASSSSSRKRVSSTNFPSLGTSFSLIVTIWFIHLAFGILCLVLGNSFASVQDFASILLTLISGQLLFFFQSNLICILYCYNCRHVYFILDIISQAVDVTINFILISLYIYPSLIFIL
jgi:hypothetical protein